MNSPSRFSQEVHRLVVLVAKLYFIARPRCFYQAIFLPEFRLASFCEMCASSDVLTRITWNPETLFCFVCLFVFVFLLFFFLLLRCPRVQQITRYGRWNYLGRSDLRLIRTEALFWARKCQAELRWHSHEGGRVGGPKTRSQPVAAGGLWECYHSDGNRHTGASILQLWRMPRLGEELQSFLQPRQRHLPPIQGKRKLH